MMPDSGPGRAWAESGLPDDRAVDSVMRALAFVEERLGEDIGVLDMAAAACYSAFHFSRLFIRATGHSPYDYLMRRRVAAAAERVARGGASITDIALDFGFGVPDTFARAFRRCFGLAPSEARREGSYPRAVSRTRIERSYVEAMLSRGPVRAESVEFAPAVVEGSWSEDDWPGKEPGPGENLVGIVERDASLGAAKYFLGSYRPTENVSVAPDYPLAATRIEGGHFARFGVAPPRKLDFVVSYAYRTWLPSIGRSRPPRFDIVEVGDLGSLSLLLPLGGEP